MRRLGIIALLAALGCYSPTYLVGLKCSDKNTCPPGQGCDPQGICMPTASGGGGTAGRLGNGGASGASGGRAGAAGAGAGNNGGTGTDGGARDSATDGRPPVDAGPRCGDGKIDDGEECDDHNTAAGDGCGPTCQIEGLVGHWALGMQYMNGDSVPDLVAPGHPGTIVAIGDEITGLVADRFDDQAGALSITQDDAISDAYAYVKMSGLTSLAPPVTMTIWVNRQSGNGIGLVMGIDQGPQLYEESTAITARVPSSANNYSGTSDVALANGAWTFLAAVFTQAGGSWQVTLYVNDAPTTSTPAVTSVASRGNFTIGGLYDREGCSAAEQVCDNGFVGYYNDARIYGRALTAQEVQALFSYKPAAP